MDSVNSVVVAISTQQHSYRSCRSLVQYGLLDRYFTTIFYRRNKLLYRLLDVILPDNEAKKMHGRYDEMIDAYETSFCTHLSLLRMLGDRIDKKQLLKSFLNHTVERAFADRVVKAMRPSAELVVSYDCYSYELYKRLAAQDVLHPIRLLDMASIPSSAIVSIMQKERALSPSLRKEIESEIAKRTIEYEEERDYEIAQSDYCLVGCSFAGAKMMERGYPKERLKVVPLGVDVSKFTMSPRQGISSKDKLRFLFVGRICPTKGIAHLLNAFTALDDPRCELIMVGQQRCSSEYLDPFLKTGKVKLLGMLRKDEMAHAYADADVYILSSLYEGFSLSLVEAMASGLPVIASKNSVAPDIITEGVEGFVYDPFDENSLCKHMQWMIEHRDDLFAMGGMARQRALTLTWERYDSSFADAVKSILCCKEGTTANACQE